MLFDFITLSLALSWLFFLPTSMASPIGYYESHRDQPVKWRRWEKKTFLEARTKNLPIFVNIGYASCHWCEVMSNESFENKKVAKMLNEKYIPVIVDQARSPQLAQLYLKFLELTQSSAGYPLNLWLDYKKSPFYASGYLPPFSNLQYPMGLFERLRFFAKVYKEDRSKINKVSEKFFNKISPPTGSHKAKLSSSIKLLDKIMKTEVDLQNGGRKGVIKYPLRFPYNDLRLRSYLAKDQFYQKEIGDYTLYRILTSPLYDQISGGLHRYSEKGDWSRPHFEKMLADNSLFIIELLRPGTDKMRAYYLHKAKEIGDFILSELKSEGGLFHNSLDSDSQTGKGKRQEGGHYIFSAAELKKVVPKKNIKSFTQECAVSFDGNRFLLGLNSPLSYKRFKQEAQAPPCISLFKKIKQKGLKKHRPAKDAALPLGANALTAIALTRLGTVSKEDKYEQAGQKALRALLGRLEKTDLEKEEFDALVYLTRAFLVSFRHTGDVYFFKKASEMARHIEKVFQSERKGFYHRQTELKKEFDFFKLQSPDLPSPFFWHYKNLTDLYQLTYDEDFLSKRNLLAGQIKAQWPDQIFSKGMLEFLVMENLVWKVAVIAQGENSLLAEKLTSYINLLGLPHLSFVQSRQQSDLHLFKGKKPVKNKSAVYFCGPKSCSKPFTDFSKAKDFIIRLLEEVKSLPGELKR